MWLITLGFWYFLKLTIPVDLLDGYFRLAIRRYTNQIYTIPMLNNLQAVKYYELYIRDYYTTSYTLFFIVVLSIFLYRMKRISSIWKWILFAVLSVMYFFVGVQSPGKMLKDNLSRIFSVVFTHILLASSFWKLWSSIKWRVIMFVVWILLVMGFENHATIDEKKTYTECSIFSAISNAMLLSSFYHSVTWLFKRMYNKVICPIIKKIKKNQRVRRKKSKISNVKCDEVETDEIVERFMKENDLDIEDID